MVFECHEKPAASSGSAHFWLSRRGGLIFSRTLGHGPVLSKSSCSSMSEDHSRSFDLEVRELLLSAVPLNCSARVQRWALKLTQFNYRFEYSKGVNNVNSDYLSRFPLPEMEKSCEPVFSSLFI